MRTPRQLLIALAAALVTIGVFTFRYPPRFLALTPLWCTVAVVAGITCLLAAINPRRFYVSASGATVVVASASRGFALAIEWWNANTDVEAGYIVGTLSWWIIATLSFVCWREYVLPWSIGRHVE